MFPKAWVILEGFLEETEAGTEPKWLFLSQRFSSKHRVTGKQNRRHVGNGGWECSCGRGLTAFWLGAV